MLQMKVYTYEELVTMGRTVAVTPQKKKLRRYYLGEQETGKKRKENVTEETTAVQHILLGKHSDIS